jgi:hypothetical protein
LAQKNIRNFTLRKIVFTMMLIASTLSADWIGQAGLGYSRGDNDADHVTGFIGINAFMGAGLRLEYTKNFSEHSNFQKEDISRYGLFAIYQFGLIPNIAITPKIGLVKTDGEFEVSGVAKALTKSSTEFTYGLELDYYYNDFLSIFIGYTNYGDELDIDDIDTSEMDTANFTLGFKLHL